MAAFSTSFIQLLSHPDIKLLCIEHCTNHHHEMLSQFNSTSYKETVIGPQIVSTREREKIQNNILVAIAMSAIRARSIPAVVFG